jgi:Outer membrane protein beta-barrel domain
MKICTMWLTAATLFLLAAASANAQTKFELNPFVGYETTASYPVSLITGPVNSDPIDRLRVNGATAFGTFIDYSLTEHFQPEFMWNRNNTSYSAHDQFTNSYISAYHSVIDQYQFGGLYLFRLSDVKLRPYVAASVGFTHDENGNSTPNRTEFSYSLGGGVKYYASRHIGLRADLRYLPTFGSSSNELFCDPFFGCYYANVSHYLNRGSFTGGIIFAF